MSRETETPEVTANPVPEDAPADGVSESERARWNRLANTMEYFHSYFKDESHKSKECIRWLLQRSAHVPPNVPPRGRGLKKHLEAHHSIEERFIFPLLAKRMNVFGENEQHRKSHHGIHEGLDRLSKLTQDFRTEPTSYSPNRMRECLDSFKDVLMRHLDEEVRDLAGENLRKYWTLEEIERIAM